MLDEKYKDYLMDKSEQNPDYHITLKISPGDLPKTTKISKKMDEETADKAREDNDIIRIKRKELVDPVAELIANFKMNWISAPVRKMMNAALA